MNLTKLITAALLASLLSGCAKEEIPPITVGQFMADPILLEATVVRCAHDRSATKYEAECVNAREAGNRLASDDREDRRKELEAQSARKRQALRRTQQAATEARRRATQAQRQREADEYLGIIETAPSGSNAVQDLNGGVVNTTQTQRADVLPGNQPGVSVAPIVNDEPEGTADASQTDINSIRDELRRRAEASN
jgi:hypothetical protein